MAIRTYKVTLDTKNAIAPEPVFLRQGDRTGAVVIDATVMDNGTPVSISGFTPMFRANTADGEAVIADSTGFTIVDAVGGEFTYQVPNALSSVPGKVTTAYFTFTNASGSQSTFDVAFVIKAAADITKPHADDYITIIDGTLDSLQQKIDKINAEIPSIINNFAIGIKGTYGTLAALNAAYPSGTDGIYIVQEDGGWYFWDSTQWQKGGTFQSSGIASKSIGYDELQPLAQSNARIYWTDPRPPFYSAKDNTFYTNNNTIVYGGKFFVVNDTVKCGDFGFICFDVGSSHVVYLDGSSLNSNSVILGTVKSGVFSFTFEPINATSTIAGAVSLGTNSAWGDTRKILIDFSAKMVTVPNIRIEVGQKEYLIHSQVATFDLPPAGSPIKYYILAHVFDDKITINYSGDPLAVTSGLDVILGSFDNNAYYPAQLSATNAVFRQSPYNDKQNFLWSTRPIEVDFANKKIHFYKGEVANQVNYTVTVEGDLTFTSDTGTWISYNKISKTYRADTNVITGGQTADDILLGYVDSNNKQFVGIWGNNWIDLSAPSKSNQSFGWTVNDVAVDWAQGTVTFSGYDSVASFNDRFGIAEQTVTIPSDEYQGSWLIYDVSTQKVRTNGGNRPNYLSANDRLLGFIDISRKNFNTVFKNMFTVTSHSDTQIGGSITIVGDSITVGFRTSNPPYTAYPFLLSQSAHVQTNVNAITGSTVTDMTGSDTSSFVSRFGNVDISNSEKLVIFGGHNDFRKGAQIGSIDSQNTNEFMGAFNTIIASAYEKNPKIKLYFIAPNWRVVNENDPNSWINDNIDTYTNAANLKFIDYVNAVVAIAAKYHAPCLNLNADWGVYASNQKQWLVDGLHPNDDGQKWLARKVQGFLENN